MILHELVRLYDRLAATEGDEPSPVPAYGFTMEKVSFCIVLSETGEFVGIEDIRKELDGKSVPVRRAVPAHGNRTSGIRPFFLCDNVAYLLGKDFKGKPERAIRCFEASKEFHRQMAAGVASGSPLLSVSRFLDRWNPSRWVDSQTRDGIETAWLVLRIDGQQRFVHDHPDAISAWEDHNGGDVRKLPSGTCLVTGQSEKLSRLQPAIKGIGPKAETSIVTFNLDSFWSYGKKHGENAPISDRVAHKYVAGLNYMTESRERHFVLADSTVVFWAEQETEFSNMFGFVFSGSRGDTAATEHLRVNLDRLRLGKPLDEMDTNVRFFVLGLAPNSSRLAIRFWLRDTVGGFAVHLSEHLLDCEIERQYPNEPEVVPIWRLVNESAARYSGSGNARKVSYGDPNPRLAAEVTRAVLMGTHYPGQLLSAYLGRIRADREINRTRMTAIKAVINRRRRTHGEKEVPVALQTDYPSVGYQLGRLFAALEKAQALALGDVNANIKDRYFGAASSTPGRVFPILMRLSQHHVAKAESGRWIDKIIGQVMEDVVDFPSHLNLEEQGLFAIGYYHQRNSFFRKKESTEE